MNQPTVHLAQALGHEAADKRLDILKRIGEVGSISEAARGAGVSYKAAWQAVEILSNLAGSALVEKSVGGSGGGGASLTPAGKQLLEAADLLNQARLSVLSQIEKRSDNALTLQSLAGLGLRTSMRNQLPIVIKSLTLDAGFARVELELPNGKLLHSKITPESVELLGLRVGMSALALCKATAVSVGTTFAHRPGLNLIKGEISRTATSGDGGAGGEVSVQLLPGLQLIGFSAAGQRPKAKQKVVAAFDESAVVIAVPG
jgi:molybdate transport system regulatory protein